MKINWFKVDKEHFIDDVVDIIESTTDYKLISFYNYLKQGEWCKDCNQRYHDCKCNNYIYLYNNIISDILNLIYYNCSQKFIKEIINKFKNIISFYLNSDVIDRLQSLLKKLENLLSS